MSAMQRNFIILFLLLAVNATAQSGAVAKFGIIFNDYERDGMTVLQASQAGHVMGLEIRIAAEDRTYFKLGGYYSFMHKRSQIHFDETAFFQIQDGYDFIKTICGLESRLVSQPKFNWRLSAAGAFNLVSSVKGNVRFADMSGSTLGILLSTGIDISIVSLDLGLEHGLTNYHDGNENTKPIMLMLTLGIRF